jgi:hypothetical protein
MLAGFLVEPRIFRRYRIATQDPDDQELDQNAGRVR